MKITRLIAICTIAWTCMTTLTMSAQVPANASSSREVVIGPEDSVTIVALNCEEISKTWRVSTTGDLNLPFAGTIAAAGMTPRQLQETVAERLKKIIIDPQVTVYVAELRSQPVTVTGAVEKPGVYQLEGEKTLFEILLKAGGPKNPGKTVTIKRDADRGPVGLPGSRQTHGAGYSSVELDLQEVMLGRGDKATLTIRPRDVISVAAPEPQRFVHISGEVVRPGAVELVSQDAVSLSKVLAVAGGMTQNANSAQAMVMHINSDGVQTSSTFVNLKPILEGKAKDLELTAGDVVVVPSSRLKTILNSSMNAGLTSGIASAFFILAKY
jgi:polysaccharide export outer membrane protein